MALFTTALRLDPSRREETRSEQASGTLSADSSTGSQGGSRSGVWPSLRLVPGDASLTPDPETEPPLSEVRPRGEQSLRDARRAEAEVDRGLVEQAQLGDARAFTALVNRHQHRAEIVAYRLIRDREEARDLVQDAFLRVHRSLDSFHGRASFFTWLYRILTNLAIDRLRRPAQRRLDYTDDPRLGEHGVAPFRANLFGDPEAGVRCQELRSALFTILEKMPDYHRDVIVMRELRGMSYDEIAQAMDVSKGTIMSRLFHARSKLQKEFSRLTEDPPGAARR